MSHESSGLSFPGGACCTIVFPVSGCRRHCDAIKTFTQKGRKAEEEKDESGRNWGRGGRCWYRNSPRAVLTACWLCLTCSSPLMQKERQDVVQKPMPFAKQEAGCVMRGWRSDLIQAGRPPATVKAAQTSRTNRGPGFTQR